jgi:hypothetical protein
MYKIFRIVHYLSTNFHVGTVTKIKDTLKFSHDRHVVIIPALHILPRSIGCSERRLIGHSFYRRNFLRKSCATRRGNSAAQHHVLRSLISLHNEHLVLPYIFSWIDIKSDAIVEPVHKFVSPPCFYY